MLHGSCSKGGASICSNGTTNPTRSLGSHTKSLGGASFFSNDADNHVEGALAFNDEPIKDLIVVTESFDQSSAKEGASVLNGEALIQQDKFPEVHQAFKGAETNPWQKQQFVKRLRALNLSLRLNVARGLTEEAQRKVNSTRTRAPAGMAT